MAARAMSVKLSPAAAPGLMPDHPPPGRHTGNSLMQDAGVDQELRMREVGHANKSVNDRYTHPPEQALLAAAEQTAALVRKARNAPHTPLGCGVGVRRQSALDGALQSCAPQEEALQGQEKDDRDDGGDRECGEEDAEVGGGLDAGQPHGQGL
jgi:hypothetical protein